MRVYGHADAKNIHTYRRRLYAVVSWGILHTKCVSHLMSVFTNQPKKKYYENFAFFRCFVRLCSHKCIDISRNNGFSSFFLASFAAARHVLSHCCYCHAIYTHTHFFCSSSFYSVVAFIPAVAVNFRSVRIRYISGGWCRCACTQNLFIPLAFAFGGWLHSTSSLLKTLYLFKRSYTFRATYSVVNSSE